MSTVKIKSGSDYHFYVSNGNYDIYFYTGGALNKQTVIGGVVSSPEICAYVSEKVKLHDGNFLNRVREKISIKDE